jgi:glycosyltransferase involved in cell wall biosynthesis
MKFIEDTTFIIVAYNRPQSLLNLIESIRKYYSNRIIIADNGIYWLTPKALEGFGDIENYVLERDCGLSASRNFLLDKIETKYGLLLDDDFIFTDETRIEDLYEHIQHYDILSGDVYEARRGCISGFFGNLEIKDNTILHKKVPIYEPHKLKSYSKKIAMYNRKMFKSSNNKVIEKLNEKKQEYADKVEEIKNTHNLPNTIIKCEIVPNFFLFDVSKVRQIRWDDNLKMSEHTDFFLRCKNKLRVGYLPSVYCIHMRDRCPSYTQDRNHNSSEGLAQMFAKYSCDKLIRNNGCVVKRKFVAQS